MSTCRHLSPCFYPIARLRHRHEDPKPLDDGVILSEAEFDSMSKQNVQRWVSAHIIPVSPLPRHGRSRVAHRSPPVWQSQISLASDGEYETLLSGKNVTFTVSGGDKNTPEWTHVVLDGSVRLLGMKEVSSPSIRFGIGATGCWR